MPFYSHLFGFVRLIGIDKPFYLSISHFKVYLAHLELDLIDLAILERHHLPVGQFLTSTCNNSFVIFDLGVLLFSYPDQSLICVSCGYNYHW